MAVATSAHFCLMTSAVITNLSKIEITLQIATTEQIWQRKSKLRPLTLKTTTRGEMNLLVLDI